MSGYIIINLKDMITEIGEAETRKRLSDFSCPPNPDVEHFLKHTAIEFSKQNISNTFIVMASYQKEFVIVGYFSLTIKIFCIDKEALPNRQWKKRIAKFGQLDQTTKRYNISAPLIGQLGKNYQNNYDKQITGDELLALALHKVTESQLILGGKIVYLECEDKDKLTEFYSRNGFCNFGQRKLDKDETLNLSGDYLIQMLRYMD